MKRKIIEEIKVEITKLIPGGYGLGCLENGKKCLLLNVLPGEIVTKIEILKEKSSYLEGVALNVERHSTKRVEPKDECFLSTSPWQILDYEFELSVKQESVVELYREQGLEIQKPEIITDGREYFYRNKMEYALYYDKEKERIFPAFHKRGSHQKIPIVKSSLEKPEIFKCAQEIVEDLNRRGEDARKYQSLLLRSNARGEVSGGLFENGKPHPVFPKLTDEIMGRTYSYSPNGFFQVNLPVYELALLEIQKQITNEKVLDLYAGVGTIGLSVVSRSTDLTLVEVDKAAFSELKQNAQRFLGDNIATTGVGLGFSINGGLSLKPKAVLSKSEEALDLITDGQTVILDPPRAGCDARLIERLLEVRPEQIIYLSCNPATQARDVKNLVSAYEIDFMKTFNFFPHTPHIENLVVLNKI